MAGGQPEVGVLGRHLEMRSLLLAVLVLTMAGCSGSAPESAPTPTPPPTRATPVVDPAVGACHELAYLDAVAPTNASPDLSCEGAHTAETFHVGHLKTLVDGHLAAVDSQRVERQVRESCPTRLAAYLGGSEDQIRLSMLRAVWFTPAVAASDAGSNWFRCDVIEVAGDQQLTTLSGSLKGVLASDGASAVAMCGTAKPDAEGFRRLPCSEDHTWRAITVVPLDADSYPGEDAAKAAGQEVCDQAGLDAAEDALDYQWGYEWPTAEQWTAGQTYGLCWAPEAAQS